MTEVIELPVQDEVATAEPTPLESLMGEIKPGMTRLFFPAERKRYVHVSREAIAANRQLLEGEKPWPTCVLWSGFMMHVFHAVILRGPAALTFAPGSFAGADAYLVTTEAIDVFIDPGARSEEEYLMRFGRPC